MRFGTHFDEEETGWHHEFRFMEGCRHGALEKII